MDYQIYSIITTQGQTTVVLPYNFLSLNDMFVSYDGNDFIPVNSVATELTKNSFEFIEPLDEGINLEFRRMSPTDFITSIQTNFNKVNFNKEIQNQYNILNEIKLNFENDLGILNRIGDVVDTRDPNIMIGDIEILLEGVADPDKHLLCDGSVVSEEQYPSIIPFLKLNETTGDYTLPDYTALFSNNAKFYIRYEL